MQKREVEQRLRRLLGEVFGLPESALPGEPDQSTVEQWDSLGHLRLILRVESTFSVHFSTAKIPKLTSLRALLEEIPHEPG